MNSKVRKINSFLRLAILVSLIAFTAFIGSYMCLYMPGKSYSGPTPKLNPELLSISNELKQHITVLSVEIGPRNFQYYQKLMQCADYIACEFRKANYQPIIQCYQAEKAILSTIRGAPQNDPNIYKNIIAEKKGTTKPDEIIIIGAHYDSIPFVQCPAANDNASGVAATLLLAKRFANFATNRTIRFVAFANEEPPYFWTTSMGSYIYAKSCKEKKENIVGMISIETIGFYSDKIGSQHYPIPLNLFYPSTGNFIAFVGNIRSASFLKKCIAEFRKTTSFPSEGAALPSIIPGVGWSDHWAFWQFSYPAIMITDTAPYRYPYYHTSNDTIDKLDFEKMSIVVSGLEKIIAFLANE